jgi:hypothetical protein
MVKPKNTKQNLDDFFALVKWTPETRIKISQNWPGKLYPI